MLMSEACADLQPRDETYRALKAAVEKDERLHTAQTVFVDV